MSPFFGREPLLLFTVPVLSTLLGGLLALRLRRHLSLLIALGAGLLLGAAFLDLLPEAIALGANAGISTPNVLGMTLIAFLLFHSFGDVLAWFNRRFGSSLQDRRVARRTAAGMLIFHSFRDGMAIGAAYSASHAAGVAVACGIAAHDLGDGMNTVILTTDGERARASGYVFLLADAIAPFLGAILTVYWILPLRGSVVLLTLASGFFLQMATGDFLPELRHAKGARRFLVPSILLGASLIYVANILIARQH